MGCTRNILGFFHRSYCIYSRMAVGLGLIYLVSVNWGLCFQVSIRARLFGIQIGAPGCLKLPSKVGLGLVRVGMR